MPGWADSPDPLNFLRWSAWEIGQSMTDCSLLPSIFITFS